MPTAALFLALAAAGLHAFWNLVIARARDVEAATAVVLALSIVLYAPVAALTWDVERDVWPYAVASAVLELAYVVLLAAAYRRADLSVVYPVARGVAPVLVGRVRHFGRHPSERSAIECCETIAVLHEHEAGLKTA